MAGATGGVLGVRTPTAPAVTTLYLVGVWRTTITVGIQTPSKAVGVQTPPKTVCSDTPKPVGVQTPIFRIVLLYNKHSKYGSPF